MERQSIRIPGAILEAILEHAKRQSPAECCGLIGGAEFSGCMHYPLRNRASEPESRYFAAPEDLFDAMREMRAQDLKLVAIYHSHPRGKAYPSETDVELAFYPDVVHLIQSLEPVTELRAYLIRDQRIEELPIVTI